MRGVIEEHLQIRNIVKPQSLVEMLYKVTASLVEQVVEMGLGATGGSQLSCIAC